MNPNKINDTHCGYNIICRTFALLLGFGLPLILLLSFILRYQEEIHFGGLKSYSFKTSQSCINCQNKNNGKPQIPSKTDENDVQKHENNSNIITTHSEQFSPPIDPIRAKIADICNGKYTGQNMNFDKFKFPFEKYTFYNNSNIYLYQRKYSVESKYLVHSDNDNDNNHNNEMHYDSNYNYNLDSAIHRKGFEYFSNLDKNKKHKSFDMNKYTMDISFVDYDRHYIYFGVPKVGSSKIKSLVYYYSTKIHDNTRNVHFRMNREIRNKNTYQSNGLTWINLIGNRKQFQNLIFFLDDKQNGKTTMYKPGKSLINKRSKNRNQNQNQNQSKTDGIPSISYHPDQTYFKFVFIRDPLSKFLSAFLDRCLIEEWKGNVCEWVKTAKDEIEKKKTTKEEKLNDKELFNIAIDILYDKIVTNKMYFNIDRHFRLQVFECQMYDFVSYFDMIVLYDKQRFANNLKYIMQKIVSRNVYPYDDDKLVEMKYIEQKYFDRGWGDHGKDSLFGEGYHVNTMNNNGELKLLKQYYNKRNAIKALEIYQYDYMMLPLPTPWWITELPD